MPRDRCRGDDDPRRCAPRAPPRKHWAGEVSRSERPSRSRFRRSRASAPGQSSTFRLAWESWWRPLRACGTRLRKRDRARGGRRRSRRQADRHPRRRRSQDLRRTPLLSASSTGSGTIAERTVRLPHPPPAHPPSATCASRTTRCSWECRSGCGHACCREDPRKMRKAPRCRHLCHVALASAGKRSTSGR
jgi:hypothetical protein